MNILITITFSLSEPKPRSHHPELGLGLLQQVVLLRLADAGEDSSLGVEVQNVSLQVCQEVTETANAAHPRHALEEDERDLNLLMNSFSRRKKEA